LRKPGLSIVITRSAHLPTCQPGESHWQHLESFDTLWLLTDKGRDQTNVVSQRKQ
jgi:hypothetical protein